MNTKPLIPEVLAPAGDRERLIFAIAYGADAVYLSGTEYGMRAGCSNFSRDELAWATQYVHEHQKKIYITVNILPRNKDVDRMPEYFSFLNSIGVDALIISDLGALRLAKEYAPDCALHISTQFGIVNYATAVSLYEMGAKRVVLARELSLKEIEEIRALTPPELELEAFVHGAICMSYSGRCVISNYLTGRDANHGECAQPCRWKYTICEETRPNTPLTLEQDETGSYLFNSNDMNMLPYIASLSQAGITSLKIEGRAKSFYYSAVMANAYRHAVDGFVASGYNPDYVPEDWILQEAYKISHRPYGTGFYFGMPKQHLEEGGYIRSYEVAGIVRQWKDGELEVEQRNRFFLGDELEVLSPNVKPFAFTVKSMADAGHHPIDVAPHATMTVFIPMDTPLEPGTILRYNKENK